jgi:hypothetical protein
MPPRQWPTRGHAKKLTRALALLEDDCFWLFKGASKPLSLWWFGQVIREWMDWKNGIPPSREWSGRAGQNPHLLDAFAAINRAEGRANETRRAEIERQRANAAKR